MYTLGSVKLQSDLGLAARGSSCGFALEKKDVTVILNKKIGKKPQRALAPQRDVRQFQRSEEVTANYWIIKILH